MFPCPVITYAQALHSRRPALASYMGSALTSDSLKIILACSSQSVCRATLMNKECADYALDLWAMHMDSDSHLMCAIDHCKPQNCGPASYMHSTSCEIPILLFTDPPARLAPPVLITERLKP